MVLNEIIKARAQPILNPLGHFLGEAGVTPNVLSSAGFGLGLIAGLLFALRPSQPYLAALSIMGCGFLDMLDGAVARATHKILPGSLNDSIMDRMSETAIYAGIIYAGYDVSSTIVLLTLGMSLTVSYVLAKGESLGITMPRLGIGDRADRLAGLIAFSFVGYVWIAIYLNLILAVIAFIHRYSYIARAIGERVSEGNRFTSGVFHVETSSEEED